LPPQTDAIPPAISSRSTGEGYTSHIITSGLPEVELSGIAEVLN
jgi:hypothetical protein